MPDAKAVSKDSVAADHHGMRRTGVMYLDQPCELGYHCPTCVYPLEVDGEFDERLEWSEYNAFIWCRVCNTDYPSALCLPGNAKRGIDIFHQTVAEAMDRARHGVWQDIEAMHMAYVGHEQGVQIEWCHVCRWLLATSRVAEFGR